eukprot:555642-Lingulodinium_polyedra.AAC.1
MASIAWLRLPRGGQWLLLHCYWGFHSCHVSTRAPAQLPSGNAHHERGILDRHTRLAGRLAG